MSKVDEIPKAKWPFQLITDRLGQRTSWVVLHAPIQSEDRVDLFCRYRRAGCRFLGMTSFMEFPAGRGDEAVDYGAVCEGWAHCFRRPDLFIPEGHPFTLVSLSDFIDPSLINPHRFESIATDKVDYVYVGAEEPWKQNAKNWPLAKVSIEKFSRYMGLRGVVIGNALNDWEPPHGVSVRPRLPYDRFLALLSQCKFLFLPNVTDASPRVIAEALCLNVPVLMNENIIGGWKYLTGMTGRFFSDEHDVLPCAELVMSARFQPRLAYMNSFGPYRAEQKLARLLQTLDPEIRSRRPLQLEALES